ncbi:hypothetical protein CR51_11885 [Caballeronia megalochromosomata]|nr:hypothetical protein CR51_11885 [Caballeronia megalochromosomata]
MDPEILAKFKRFGPTELDQVPDKPGLYAWYAKPQIGPADWARAVDSNGADFGEQAFRSVLAKHTSRFTPPALRVAAHNAFRDTWEGRLTPSIYDRHVGAINRKELSETEANSMKFPKAAMEKMLLSEKQRARMTQLLTSAATPLLASPLYIGKSADLRRRVNEHFSDLDKWHQVIQRDPNHRDSIRSALFGSGRNTNIPDIFATRAIASGFSPDNLEVYVLDIAGTLGIQETLALELAEALEWLLNTWHRPILGRA